MFTGEPPSTHLTLQSSDTLPNCFTTLADHLGSAGYRRTGFCNNPLVGLIQNDLPRGFEDFYLYCGTIKSMPPKTPRHSPGPIRTAWQNTIRSARDLVAPIQAIFAQSNRIFQASLNPIFVPLWSRFAHFKGDTPTSIRDATCFVAKHLTVEAQDPHFVFLNLMEPHLPYSPPDAFVRAFAPAVQEDGEAQRFMRAFNRQAVHWITPAAKPYSELEASTLSDMYDAEVAYQDHLLGELLDALDEPECRDRTLVIVVADHGEMLGERQLMGHGFGVYRELIHVPLIVRLPGQTTGQSRSDPVSTTRLFHTVLDAAGIATYETHYGHTVRAHQKSLLNGNSGAHLNGRTIVCEAYAPEFALTAVEKHKPDLLSPLACRATHWAVVQEAYKLIHVEDTRSELYRWADDPLEERALQNDHDTNGTRQQLLDQLDSFLERARQHSPSDRTFKKADLNDEHVRQRLRGLGYIE
jgi:uncharacterized sulfatase